MLSLVAPHRGDLARSILNDRADSDAHDEQRERVGDNEWEIIAGNAVSDPTCEPDEKHREIAER